MLYNAFGRPQATTLELTAEFPKKIWQSWKVDSVHFEDRDIERVRTWTTLNPRHQYEVLTDDNAETYVQYHFGPAGFNRPDIVSTYMALSQPSTRIIQADLLRYLILYADGGVWADIDVEAIRPIDSFIPRGFDESEISMIVGIETDEPALKDHPILGSKARSFVQWTFCAKPQTTIMMRLINHILVWLNELADEQGCSIPEVEMDFDTVLSGTGPSAFTEAILREMSRARGEEVTWDHFHDLEDSMLVAGVLVLPSEAFAAGTGHSKSGNHFGQRALVKHHFHASSWTKKHARQKHPIYDEVERCNWKVECVRLWDANVAAFDALPEAEQLKIIEAKRFPAIKAPEPPTMDQKPVEAPKSAATKGAAVVKQALEAVKDQTEGKVTSEQGPKDAQGDKKTQEDKTAEKEGKGSQSSDSKDAAVDKKPSPKPSDGGKTSSSAKDVTAAAKLLKEAADRSKPSDTTPTPDSDEAEPISLDEDVDEDADTGAMIASMLMKDASIKAQSSKKTGGSIPDAPKEPASDAPAPKSDATPASSTASPASSSTPAASSHTPEEKPPAEQLKDAALAAIQKQKEHESGADTAAQANKAASTPAELDVSMKDGEKPAVAKVETAAALTGDKKDGDAEGAAATTAASPTASKVEAGSDKADV